MITNYPQDTDTEFYIYGECDLAEILERANDAWPNISPDDIKITSEYRHVTCLTYDLYDPSDYACYIKVSKAQLTSASKHDTMYIHFITRSSL